MTVTLISRARAIFGSHRSFKLATAFVWACLVSLQGAMAQQCLQAPAGIASWWPLDETQGRNVADWIGDAPGTHVGALTPTPGIVRGSLAFSGSGHVAIADRDRWAFERRNFTIELWANFSSPGAGSIGHPSHIFIGSDEGPGTRNKWFFALGGGFLNFHINSPSFGPKFFPLVPFTPAVGTWYHLALVRDGTTYTIYINGVAGGSETNSDSVPNASAPLTIGQAEELGYMSGRLDEVTIYDRALLAGEVAAIHRAGSAGKCQVHAVRPREGGDTGPTTLRVFGSDWAGAVSARLVRSGQADIEATRLVAVGDDSAMDATFDLSGRQLGPWDLVIGMQDGSARTIAGQFSIVAGRSAALWVDLLGLPVIVPNRKQTYWIAYGNSGNVDSSGGYVLLQIPPGITYTIGDEGVPESGLTRRLKPIKIGPTGAGQTRYMPVTIDSQATTGQLPLRADIRHSLEQLIPGLNRHEPAFAVVGATTSRSTASTVKRSAATAESAASLSKSVVQGESGGTGYVHLFWITNPDGTGFGEAAISKSPTMVTWSFPMLGVVDAPFIANGPYPVRTPDGRVITVNVRHIVGFRPLPEADMQALTDDLERRLSEWRGSPFSDPSHFDAKTGKWAVSCMGLVLRVLHPGGWKGKVEATGKCPPPRAGELCYTTEDLLRSLDGFKNGGDVVLSALVDVLRSTDLPAGVRELIINLIRSFDPNEKIGALGFGTAGYVGIDEPLRYVISFENVASASAPAQEVTITDQLDPAAVDLSSLVFGPVGFGGRAFVPVAGPNGIVIEADLRPEQDLLVRINGTLDPNSGLLQWRFAALDPVTGDRPADPRIGFLPPNKVPPEGDGSVVFTVLPRHSSSVGVAVRNSASIIFDTNEPILTQTWVNTIDAQKPSSAISELPAVHTIRRFPIQWSGTDIGAGVRDYRVYVSANGSPYAEVLRDTASTSGMFDGVFGDSYSIYSLARDFVGNVEESPVVRTTRIVRLAGDADGDGDVDNDDLKLILAAVKSAATGPADPRDVDKDGMITALDTRKLVTLCTRPRCATR